MFSRLFTVTSIAVEVILTTIVVGSPLTTRTLLYPRSPSESDDTRCPPPLESESLPPSPPPPPPPLPPDQGQGLPTGLGPPEYPYPYYYYPSKVSALSFQASLLLVMLLCFTAVL
ncbi:hypothetical protein V6N13_118921 [Hibiscus sabdariffa]|uniref:Uncharacterized protein n=1 Tax=Hibiscus sabdariffa TaxID=183260 RepID=A0ABR2E1I9_9ROSI